MVYITVQCAVCSEDVLDTDLTDSCRGWFVGGSRGAGAERGICCFVLAGNPVAADVIFVDI